MNRNFSCILSYLYPFCDRGSIVCSLIVYYIPVLPTRTQMLVARMYIMTSVTWTRQIVNFINYLQFCCSKLSFRSKWKKNWSIMMFSVVFPCLNVLCEQNTSSAHSFSRVAQVFVHLKLFDFWLSWFISMNVQLSWRDSVPVSVCIVCTLSVRLTYCFY